MEQQKTWQVVFSGVGGQGLVMAGYLLGEAASASDGLNATMVMTYGAESRGTFTKADVIISHEPIDFPEVVKPDFVIALAQVAYDRYAGSLDENAYLIYDTENVVPREGKAKQIGYPITEIAMSAGGILSCNMVSLGIFVATTGIIQSELVAEAIESRFAEKPEVAKKNVASFQKGLAAAKK